MECSICGASELVRPIFRALSPTGIVLVCENCAQEQGYPLVKKPGVKKEDLEKRDTVYETMVRLTGVKRKEPERFELINQERKIKEVVNKNYEKKIKQETVSLAPRPDLVDNFHWIIMRVRRVKGLTQGQLADRIGETEAAIKMAEQGIIPQGYELLNKLERFLGVRLVKDRAIPPETNFQKTQMNLNNSNIVPETKKPEPAKIVYPKSGIINFDRKILENLKIDDLKKIKMEKEKGQNAEKEASEEKKYVQDYD